MRTLTVSYDNKLHSLSIILRLIKLCVNVLLCILYPCILIHCYLINRKHNIILIRINVMFETFAAINEQIMKGSKSLFKED